ncbi:hypothetical protein AK812_SmicGene3373 [Symbiodinium microadriaticum]|uniref:Uncharacterized protein n=1 Tax=Symbiodinium microadriaticum TaxID=2951 RepID=A0A1Q9EZ05_SYMMI|nr:hypothetical protein AK812_SmicGene3373 [Symbiodinium microadriaticum]
MVLVVVIVVLVLVLVLALLVLALVLPVRVRVRVRVLVLVLVLLLLLLFAAACMVGVAFVFVVGASCAGGSGGRGGGVGAAPADVGDCFTLVVEVSVTGVVPKLRLPLLLRLLMLVTLVVIVPLLLVMLSHSYSPYFFVDVQLVLRTTFDNLEMFERLFVQSDEMLCKPSAPTECLVGSCVASTPVFAACLDERELWLPVRTSSAFEAQPVGGRAVGGLSWSLQNEQTMGFSGARVADVLCETDGGEKLLFLKVVEPSPLPATATAEAAKRKWDRNLQSYANEVMFLSNDAIKEAAAGNGFLLGVEAVPGKRYALLTASWKASEICTMCCLVL